MKPDGSLAACVSFWIQTAAVMQTDQLSKDGNTPQSHSARYRVNCAIWAFVAAGAEQSEHQESVSASHLRSDQLQAAGITRKGESIQSVVANLLPFLYLVSVIHTLSTLILSLLLNFLRKRRNLPRLHTICRKVRCVAKLHLPRLLPPLTPNPPRLEGGGSKFAGPQCNRRPKSRQIAGRSA